MKKTKINSRISKIRVLLTKNKIISYIFLLLFILQIFSLPNLLLANTISKDDRNELNSSTEGLINPKNPQLETEENLNTSNEILNGNSETTIKVTSVESVTFLNLNVSQTISDKHFVVDESVIIGYNTVVSFNNVTIEFNNTNSNNHPFIVSQNASFTAINSHFIISEFDVRWYMMYERNSSVYIKDSLINSIGVPETTDEFQRGIYAKETSILFDNVSFINSRNTIFTIYNSNNTVIQNNLIIGGNTVANIENCSYFVLRNNDISLITGNVLLLDNITNMYIENNNIGSAFEYTQLQRAVIGNAITFLTIYNNTIFSNGMYFTELNHSIISNNNLIGIDPNRNNWDIGIQLLGCKNISLYKNILTTASHPRGFSLGIFVTDYQQFTSEIITITDNTIDSFIERGIEIYRTSTIIIENNIIERGVTTDFGGLLDPTGVGLSLSSFTGVEYIQNNTFQNLLQAIHFDNAILDIYFSDSLFFLNNFIDNSVDYNQTNIPLTTVWTVNGTGNYWSSFIGTDIDQNGITEQDKEIVPEQVYDYAPLYYPNIPPMITTSLTHNEFLTNGVNQFVNWHIDDEDALNYTIYINNTITRANTINGSSIVSLNIDGFVSSWYQLKFIAQDRWLNSFTSYLMIFVYPDDLTAPIFSDIPTNITIRELEPEKDFVFNVTDEHPDSYTTILYNETNSFIFRFDTGTWNSDQIIVSLGNLFDGNYALNVTATDILNQESTITVPVYVQDLGPLIVGNENRTIGQDSITNLEWTFYDADLPIHFWLYIDNVLVDDADWVSGLPYNYFYNSTDVTLETHSFRMVANDTKNLPNEFYTYITIIDNIFPIITPFGDNPSTIDEFDPPVTFYWNASDKNPSNYSVSFFYFDSEDENNTWTNIDSGLWTGEDIQYTFNATDYPIGTYQLRASVTDLGNNTAYSLGGQFQIIDSTPPNFTAIPMNITLEYGFPAPLLNWSLHDKNMQSYLIIVNGTIRTLEEWNQTMISFYADEYLWTSTTETEDRLNTYELTLIAIDDGGNTANASVWITVEDTLTPTIINYTPTIERVHNLHSDNFTFYCEDMTLKSYSITLNDNLFRNGYFNNLTNGEITIFDSNLYLGVNELFIILEDNQNNKGYYSVSVSIIDIATPLILNEPPSNIIKYWPTSRLSLNWEIWDIRPDSYTLYHNGSIIETGFLTSKIDTVVTFTIGFHNFTLEAKDTSGNFIISTVWINCLDTDKPYIRSVQPAATMIFFVNDTLFVEAIVEDAAPDYYTFFLNDSLIITSSWESMKEEIFFVKLNSPGYFTWNLTFYDSSGNSASFTNDLIVKIFIDDSPTQINLPGRTLFDDIALIGTLTAVFFIVKYSIRGIKKRIRYIIDTIKRNPKE